MPVCHERGTKGASRMTDKLHVVMHARVSFFRLSQVFLQKPTADVRKMLAAHRQFVDAVGVRMHRQVYAQASRLGEEADDAGARCAMRLPGCPEAGRRPGTACIIPNLYLIYVL